LQGLAEKNRARQDGALKEAWQRPGTSTLAGRGIELLSARCARSPFFCANATLRRAKNACDSPLVAECIPVNRNHRIVNRVMLVRIHAFTLMELLVVISIIGILAGLLFTGLNSAMNAAKKTSAKNQVIQIATAIAAYESEYGHLPPGDKSFNSSLVQVLCSTKDAVNNPRGIVFLEASAWKKGKGGTNDSGFCDPFSESSVYSVALDSGYSNSLSIDLGGGLGTTNITKHIAVWTVFTNGANQSLISSWE